MNYLTVLKIVFSKADFSAALCHSLFVFFNNIFARVLAGSFSAAGPGYFLPDSRFFVVYSLFSAIRRMALATPAFTFVSVI